MKNVIYYILGLLSFALVLFCIQMLMNGFIDFLKPCEAWELYDLILFIGILISIILPPSALVGIYFICTFKNKNHVKDN